MSTRPELKGVALMLVGIAFLSANDALSKYLAERYPIGEVICLRQIASLAFILPFALMTSGFSSLRIVNVTGQLWRGIAFIGTAVFIVASLAQLPLAIVTAIAFSSPLWVAVLAGPLLGETVTRTRWISACIGFVGVLIIMRPGGPSFTWALLLPLAGALANVARDMMTRSLARTETSISILFWSMLLSILVMGMTFPFGWTPILAVDWFWLVLAGLVNAIAHFTMIAAFRFADASALSPYRYTSLIWALALGWLIWDHFPDALSLLGAAIIVGAALVAVRQSETRAVRQGSV
ncbi:MAG: DMT family transporter [Hyphomicrobiaceae bacterium]